GTEPRWTVSPDPRNRPRRHGQRMAGRARRRRVPAEGGPETDQAGHGQRTGPEPVPPRTHAAGAIAASEHRAADRRRCRPDRTAMVCHGTRGRRGTALLDRATAAVAGPAP